MWRLPGPEAIQKPLRPSDLVVECQQKQTQKDTVKVPKRFARRKHTQHEVATPAAVRVYRRSSQ